MDNLIAEGKATPFTLSGTMAVALPGGARHRGKGKPSGPWATGWMGGWIQETLLDDIIPMIDATYRPVQTQPHRAMADSPMGGMETRITHTRPSDIVLYCRHIQSARQH